jgi:hypothetical protein
LLIGNDGDFVYIAPAIDEKFAGTEISLKPARQERRYHMHFASTPDLPMHISSEIECNVKKTGFKAQLEFFSVHCASVRQEQLCVADLKIYQNSYEEYGP